MTKIGYTIVQINPNIANKKKGAKRQRKNITATGDSPDSAGWASWPITE